MSLCTIPLDQPIPENSIYDPYRNSHPLTVKNFEKMDKGTYWFHRLISLDESWIHGNTPLKNNCISKSQSDPGIIAEYDIVYGGGGLAVIHAAMMSKVYGKKVCVFDKYAVGLTHRDWNISIPELLVLKECGLFSQEQLDSFIACKYKGGFVKFYDDDPKSAMPPLWLENVLDTALDANLLLDAAKNIILEYGGTIIEQAHFKKVITTGTYALIHIETPHSKIVLSAKVFADAMGSFSPIARSLNAYPFTHCCPTVGTISSGFKEGKNSDEIDFSVGEILVTNEHQLPDGRQLIWEGFPSSQNRFVTYLFFYDAIQSPSDKSLINLYELFFEKLFTYKKPDENFDIGRPLFGIIPSFSHHSTKNKRITADDNIISIGDAAALSSPLSYCGFGSFVRNLPKTSTLLFQALEANTLKKKDLSKINAFEPRVAIMSNFASFLQGKPLQSASTVNKTMNMFMDVLGSLPKHIAEEVFRDTLQWKSYNIMMSTVPKRHPQSYKMLIDVHGIKGLFWWAINFIGFAIWEMSQKKKSKSN